jgi:hypothetical protein
VGVSGIADKAVVIDRMGEGITIYSATPAEVVNVP